MKMAMKNIGNVVLAAACTCLLFPACRKAGDLVLASGQQKVKMYADSVTDPRNSWSRIAAGPDRLFMTYGQGSEDFYQTNGVISGFNPDVRWMITDNDGNLIRRGALPAGSMIVGITALAGNGFLAAAALHDTSNFTSIVELLRFDRNGTLLSSLPLQFPSGFTCFVNDIVFSPLPNGNLVTSILNTQQYWRGHTFVGEIDASGNFVWYRNYSSYSFSDFVPAQDGGYLFLGTKQDNVTFQPKVFLLKTGATGDSLWSKSISRNSTYSVSRNIIRSGNGGYRFTFYDYSSNVSYTTACIYAIDAAGDSLDAAVINDISDANQTWPAALLPVQGENVFYMLNSGRIPPDGSSRVNTTYAYADQGLNPTEKGTFQDQTNDLIASGCLTSDGHIACFGLIQSYNKGYYAPQLIVLK